MFNISKAVGILPELWELTGNMESNPCLPDRKAKRKRFGGFLFCFFTVTIRESDGF